MKTTACFRVVHTRSRPAEGHDEGAAPKNPWVRPERNVAGRSSDFRVILHLRLPALHEGSDMVQILSPVTAAGPCRSCTGFPGVTGSPTIPHSESEAATLPLQQGNTKPGESLACPIPACAERNQGELALTGCAFCKRTGLLHSGVTTVVACFAVPAPGPAVFCRHGQTQPLPACAAPLLLVVALCSGRPGGFLGRIARIGAHERRV